MERRTAGALIGALALVCVALLASVVLPLSYDDPHGARPSDERFGVEPPEEYRVAATLRTDGETTLAHEGAVVEDGPRRQAFEDERHRSVVYQPAPGAAVYVRWETSDASQAERIREYVENADDQRLVREERDGDGVHFYVVQSDGGDLADDVPGSAAVFLSSASIVAYERIDDGASDEGRLAAHRPLPRVPFPQVAAAGDDGSAVADRHPTVAAGRHRIGVAGGVRGDDARHDLAVYEPRGGWYDGGSEPYRVTNAAGHLLVERESGRLREARLSWTLTERAPTYAHYAVRRPSALDQTLSYDLEPGDVAVEEPAWVTDLRGDG